MPSAWLVDVRSNDELCFTSFVLCLGAHSLIQSAGLHGLFEKRRLALSNRPNARAREAGTPLGEQVYPDSRCVVGTDTLRRSRSMPCHARRHHQSLAHS